MRKEQIHYEAVIAADNQPEPTDYCISAQADHWNGFVEGFEAGAKWALVEQDTCKRDPFESLQMSYDFLKTKGFY